MTRRSARLSHVSKPDYTEQLQSEDEAEQPIKVKIEEPEKVSKKRDKPPPKRKVPKKRVKRLPTPDPDPDPKPPARPILFDCEDVVHEVCTYLCRADLLSMLTVNKVSYHAAIPSLYRHFDHRMLSCACPSCPLHGRLRGHNPDYVRRFTTALEYFPHPHVRHLSSHPDVPRLKTAIVNFDVTMLDSYAMKIKDPDAKGNAIWSGLYTCSSCPERPHAERTVFRASWSNFNVRKYTPKIIRLPKTESTEVVYHINRLLPPYYLRTPSDRPLRKVTHEGPKRQLTIVIFPFMWDHGPITKDMPAWKPKNDSFNVTFDWTLSEMVKAHHQSYNILIVGAEDVCAFAPDVHWESRHRREEMLLKKYSQRSKFYSPWGLEQLEESEMGEISTKSFISYLEDGDWGEELNVQLVHRWITAYREREKQDRAQAKKVKKQPKRGKKRRRRNSFVVDDSDDDPDGEYRG